MATTSDSLQTNAIAGPTNPKIGIRTKRSNSRKPDPTQVLERKRFCWSSAAKRYCNKVERKKGTKPIPRSCIAGIAARYLVPSANCRIGLDHAAKNAAMGKLISAKNLTLHWYASVNRCGEKCAVQI